MANHANITSVSKLVAVATCVAAVAFPAFAHPNVLTSAKVAEVYAKEPIPAEFDPATHAMPDNLIIRYLSHGKFRSTCHQDRFGCEISPSVENTLTFFYVFIDVDAVPPSLRPAVLRHEKAHVLGWRH